MTDSTSTPQCPICNVEVESRPANKTFPFCSRRCKDEDLGKWLGGHYSMPGRPASPEEFAEEIQKKYSK